MPGFSTASINNADHFGTSGEGLLCLRMCGAPFVSLFVVFGQKTAFPPRKDVGTRVGARTHTRRGGAKRSTRSEAESCAGGLSWHNRPCEGELNQLSRLNEAKRNESRVRMKIVRSRSSDLVSRSSDLQNWTEFCVALKRTNRCLLTNRHSSSFP